MSLRSRVQVPLGKPRFHADEAEEDSDEEAEDESEEDSDAEAEDESDDESEEEADDESEEVFCDATSKFTPSFETF